MTWEYRICKQTHAYKVGDKTQTSVSYGIHEVYYNDKGEIFGITENAKAIIVDQLLEEDTEADTLNEINETFELMQLAMSKPVINIDEVNFSDIGE